ncbi:hypothetical protein OSH11_24485 [Kaistia dalseonensis]|uniref:Uncharacterized protein n=1 Tax=Kaistia dalseonensis TaxID=410840 RepID=A0ABU0HDY2_9HYPH|nr:hypothetical protein [Kaistia dalseonensis]MCX5497878.1 hypothetical protein [Kaistia dalseonensis]MDQ0440522.1 hypothetical protein [Kaistia dalseonensis]
MADPRKAALPARLADIRKITAEARAKAAADTFGIGVVIVAIAQAASHGLNQVMLVPGRPLDLQAEEATKQTVKALLADGFTVEWERRPWPRPDEAPVAMIVRW